MSEVKILSENEILDMENLLAEKDSRSRKYNDELRFIVANKDKLQEMIKQFSIKAVYDTLMSKGYVGADYGYNTFRNVMAKRYKNNIKNDKYIIQYDAPKWVDSPEAGVLVDDEVNPKDIAPKLSRKKKSVEAA